MQARHPFADRQAVNIVNRYIITILYFKKVRFELVEIAGLVAQRMRIHVPFISQMFEKFGELIVKHQGSAGHRLGT